MVNLHNDEQDIDLEVTNEEADVEEPELVDVEERGADKIKKLKETISRLEDEKKQLLDESQRAKADFLNARKRLEEDRIRDRFRIQKQHVLELLPLCDSFQMAISNKEAWAKADPAWRTGIEGIHTQLQNILATYQVTTIDPTGEHFNPHKHEAVGTEVVADKKQVDTIVSVVQQGYEMKHGDTTELIRPARVTTGIAE